MKAINGMGKLKAAHKFLLLVAVPLLVSGCFGSYRGELQPATVHSINAHKDLSKFEANIAKNPLRYKVVYVSDHRGFSPRSGNQTNIVMHDYKPEELMGRVEGYIQGFLEEALQTERPSFAPESLRFIGLDIKDVDTKILHGGLVTGRFGHYYTNVVANVRVTNNEGRVLLEEPVDVTYQTMRQSFTGSQLTLEQDKENMHQTLNQALRLMAQKVIQKTD